MCQRLFLGIDTENLRSCLPATHRLVGNPIITRSDKVLKGMAAQCGKSEEEGICNINLVLEVDQVERVLDSN